MRARLDELRPLPRSAACAKIDRNGREAVVHRVLFERQESTRSSRSGPLPRLGVPRVGESLLRRMNSLLMLFLSA
jgi:hypothetical protein